MPINYVISDWNDAIFQGKDEGKLWEHVGVSALKDSCIGSLPTLTTFKLLGAMLTLKKLVKAYKHREIGYDEIYSVFNKRVLSIVPKEMVEEWTEEYAQQRKIQAKLDMRLLNPLAAMREEKRIRAAVLSTAYDHGIKSILAVRYPSHGDFSGYPFHEMIANPVVPSGHGSRFELRLYTATDKREALKRELPRYQLYATLYITDGDDVDASGEACIEYVRERGSKIAAPFFADDAFKQRVAREYDAFVPESEQDFLDFLRKG